MKSKKTALAALRLFKALPKAKAETAANHGKSKQLNDTFIRFGIYVVPEADFSVIDQSARKEILSKYGLSAEQMNQTFHKSFSAVAGASDETLRFQQALHYLTTYGVESLGFKTGEICSVYIPDEKLNLPEDSAGFRINIIGAISADEIREKVKSLSEKNIAFSSVTMEDIILLSKEYDIDLDPDAISSKELRTSVCAELNKVPSDPQEFLRLLNFLVSGDSLLIKSRNRLSALFERSKIKCGDIDKADAALELYVNKYGYVPLASIFYRHKKIWLTVKNKKKCISYQQNKTACRQTQETCRKEYSGLHYQRSVLGHFRSGERTEEGFPGQKGFPAECHALSNEISVIDKLPDPKRRCFFQGT